MPPHPNGRGARGRIRPTTTATPERRRCSNQRRRDLQLGEPPGSRRTKRRRPWFRTGQQTRRERVRPWLRCTRRCVRTLSRTRGTAPRHPTPCRHIETNDPGALGVRFPSQGPTAGPLWGSPTLRAVGPTGRGRSPRTPAMYAKSIEAVNATRGPTRKCGTGVLPQHQCRWPR